MERMNTRDTTTKLEVICGYASRLSQTPRLMQCHKAERCEYKRHFIFDSTNYCIKYNEAFRGQNGR